MIDWGAGHYEQTAVELEPVAQHVLAVADPRPGEPVVDLATGTGNAALLAARAGAEVTGLDSAPRLIDVARDRAAAEALEVSFVVGDVLALPFDEHAFDLALSVFGLIFAPEPQRAFDEMMRVLTATGRAVFSAWVPAGPIDAMVGVFSRALAAATGPGLPRFPWHDPASIEELAAPHRARVTVHDGQLKVSAASPDAYLEASERGHPMSLAGRPVLERAGTYGEARAQALEILRRANQDPHAFAISSPYRIFELQRSG